MTRFRDADYARPAVAVDVVALTIARSELQLLLVRRRDHPFKGRWALPGGFVRIGDGIEEQGEDLDEAAARELAEETGLAAGSVYLEQLYTFGRAYRDPRMRVITVAYYALVRPDLAHTVQAGSDAAEAGWRSVSEVGELNLAFDHLEIVDTALERIRGKLGYSGIAFELVPETFTTAELRAVHEVIEARELDPGNFRRRFNRLVAEGILEPVEGHRSTGSRPAKIYRFVRVGRR